MAQLYIRKHESKRGITYQVSFETAPINGKRTRCIVGSFQSREDAIAAGNRIWNEYNFVKEMN